MILFFGEDTMTFIVLTWIIFAILIVSPGILAFRIARRKKREDD